MKLISLIPLLGVLLSVSVAAHANRQFTTENSETPSAEEVWQEEIPDYQTPPGESVFTHSSAALNSDMPVDAIIDSLMLMPIKGMATVSADVLHRFVCRHNPDFDPAIAKAYICVGERYGIPGDIALCQSILETGWFRFADGTSVTPDQHNYCGLGVVSRGQKGHSFQTIEDGVTAQIQHLFAYACQEPLPEGEQLIDPRFKLVTRGVAPTWSGLAGRWAANDRYARSILKLYIELQRFGYKDQLTKRD